MPSRLFQRRMYRRYAKSLPERVTLGAEHTAGQWYGLGEGQEKSTPKLTWMRPMSTNRFRAIRHPGNVRRAARKEIQRLLSDHEEHPWSHLLSFITTSGLIFTSLLFVMNIEAYGRIASYWWDTTFRQGETSASFAALDREKAPAPTPPPLLPLPTAQASSTPDVISLQPAPSLAPLTITPPDNRIMIPKIGQNIPIVEVDPSPLIAKDWNGLEQEIQDALKDGVVRYPGTAMPGQTGNTFITGHSSYYFWDPGRYKDVFALLHEVVLGDTITVFYNQERFDYKVVEIKVVKPHEVDVLQQTDGKRLTLMTCTPIGTALNRLVVIAEQI